ncbi:c6 zinc finger domain containing protein [Grosmannia clavigera kw1407]|uniref:C6 zinc finger domain containing protein n=1 Tax=Grosmannia clavigera (strain kw1407 / UAMH 11150) TaxID=655863 RepID=F0XLG3_GROCL|nr:c6 zinc finger domain containing protein [Grosmannia clavigera kw1407]EFX01453.1 c6 zinc finger domain containing protein [Grosmannia clavigera kw1407]
MDTESRHPEANPDTNPCDSAPDDTDPAPKKSAIKKRTKTGCYIIFKDPMGTFHPNQIGPMPFQSASAHHLLASQQGSFASQNPRAISQGSLPFIAPRPPLMNDVAQYQHQLPHHPSMPPRQHPLHMQGIPAGHELHFIPPGHAQPMAPMPMSYAPSAQPDSHGHASFAQVWEPQPPLTGHGGSYDDSGFLPSVDYGGPLTVPIAVPTPALVPAVGWSSDGNYDVIDFPPVPRSHDYTRVFERGNAEYSAQSAMHSEEGYWYSDDDASMGDSEDEEATDQMEHVQANDLGVIVARRLPNRPFDAFGTQLRTFSNFADANVLADYVPSSLNSPLTDARTASVFWYFVNVTGPSMSLFERYPVDPSPIFEGRPVPRSRQHIWTYTFPTIALNHPALLQAMLALGSLHMAKLQGIPATASMKHYHLSLRRIARNYQSTSRRVQPATLAATMLLGFYEVWNSDHDKWCKHMWGARAILREIPLREMTKKMIALKRKRRQALYQGSLDHDSTMPEDGIVADKDIDLVDSVIVSQLSGLPVGYDQDEDVTSSSFHNRRSTSWTTPDAYTEKDIKTYHILSDLFWWYAKMDVYQSILGGTRLLMEYKCWTQCAPRAPINRIDAFHDQDRKRQARWPDGPPGPRGQGQSPPPFIGMMPSTGNITIPKGFSPPREQSPESDSQEEMDFDASTTAALCKWESIKQTLEHFRAQLGPDFEPLGPEYEPPASSPFGLVLKYRTYGIASIWMNYYMGMIVLHRCHPSMPHIAMAAAAMAGRQTAPYANQIGRIIAGLTVEDLNTMVHVSTLLGAVSIESSFPLFVAAVQFQDTAQRHWTVRQMHNVARLTGFQSARHIATGCETCWTKAASMGRGPPYEPPTDVAEVPQSIWNRPKRIVDRIRELEEEDEELVLSATERSRYAVGLLSMESDLEKLKLSDKA